MKKIDNSECLISFGEYIKSARELKGYTQQEMAESLEIRQSYYSMIENGQKNIPLVLALKICSELKINMNDFMKHYI